ncbi:hypothetical protein ECANGB1_359 [Enterospora canceri]|uniref:Uncharacterized protein n=1 Tax=Enterospora canceri TaxID=1081671 RepID=A0A1Y1S4F9_9MICR|nr:hypothetical protein ECANGB1_359 [Enterospora canceri]
MYANIYTVLSLISAAAPLGASQTTAAQCNNAPEIEKLLQGLGGCIPTSQNGTGQSGSDKPQCYLTTSLDCPKDVTGQDQQPTGLPSGTPTPPPMGFQSPDQTAGQMPFNYAPVQPGSGASPSGSPIMQPGSSGGFVMPQPQAGLQQHLPICPPGQTSNLPGLNGYSDCVTAATMKQPTIKLNNIEVPINPYVPPVVQSCAPNAKVCKK